MTTFIELCVKGEETVDDVQKYINKWHSSKRGFTLRETLGLTYQEYSKWLAEEISLEKILQQRRREL